MTLGMLRPKISLWVNNGVPVASDAVKDMVNEACQMIFDTVTERRFSERYAVEIDEPYLSLPRGLNKIILARINGAPIMVHGPGYVFSEGGPLNDDTTEAVYSLCDQGDAATQYDVPFELVTNATTGLVTRQPIPMNIAAFSRSIEDTGATIFIRGILETGEETTEDISLSRWTLGVYGDVGAYTYSVNKYVEIKQIVKPVTVGLVSVVTLDPATNEFSNLADFQPTDQSTSFRRYLFLGLTLNATTGKSDVPVTLYTLCRKAFVEISDDNDLVPVQNMEAMRLMMFSLRSRNAGNEPMAQQYFQSALVLVAAENENTSHRGEIIIEDSFNLGNIQNV